MLDKNKITDFVVASGTLAKRAMDALTVKTAAEQAAVATIPAVIDLLIDAGLTDATQKEANIAALSDHSKALSVLGNLATRFKAASAATKQASTIGEAVSDGIAASPEASPYVGVPNGHHRTKASQDLFNALGLSYGSSNG